ncbi:hypothetical protein F4859DRAFT_521169 [Xylaria cf. heliscus]|nr:hypothetical protein F4859DRAFT_521169 [Xylaria cf. heliscus]
MKYISDESRRLSEARKRIKELEDECSRLRTQEAGVCGTRPPRRSSPKSSSLVQPTATNDTRHYAQATVSSRCKNKFTPQKSNRQDDAATRPVLIDGRGYIYKAGVPIEIPPMEWIGYMNDTKASRSRYYEIREEREERKKRVDIRRQKPQHRKEPEEQLPTPSPSPPPVISTTDEEAIFTSDPEPEKAPEDGLIRTSRLDEKLSLGHDLVYIDIKTGLDYLREAAEITQHAIFDVKSCMPEWDTSMFQGDPNLVRLGRDEMINWMGYEFIESRRFHNGYRCEEISYDLLDVVLLRNTICHPRGSELGDPKNLDRLLKYAQRVSVVLGDEQKALKIRYIRDTLRAEVDNCLQEIKDLKYLACQPYYGVTHKRHHLKMFKTILEYYNDDYKGCKDVLAVAQAWQGVAG